MRAADGDGERIDAGGFDEPARFAGIGAYAGGVGSGVRPVGRNRVLAADPAEFGLDPDVPGVQRGFAPFMVDGSMMDCVRGRAVSRAHQRDHDAGHATINAVLLLASGAPPEYAARFRSLAKGWLRRDTCDSQRATADLGRIRRARAVLDDPDVPAAPAPTYHRQFPAQDRVVRRRPTWSLAIALCSRRIARFEWGNRENCHGWYSGDGMTYLYTGDPRQFCDDFWPTVNGYRLPGTTVSVRSREPHLGQGTVGNPAFTDRVGGVSMMDRYGAVGMDHLSWDRSLRAKKSWFCLDDMVIALGAGITSTDGDQITTCVENRNLHGDPTRSLFVDGRRQGTGPGWHAHLTGAHWAHLDGVGGYLFPGGGPLRAGRETRTGNWREINSGMSTAGSARPVTRPYLALWFDHGVNPCGASYAYALLPTADRQATETRAENSGFVVLANTETVQAITVREPHFVLANFWAAGRVGPVRVHAPASVIVARQGNRLTVAVSDPTRTAHTLRVRIDHTARHVVMADSTITVVDRAPSIALDVYVGGSAGHPHTAVIDIDQN